MRAEFHVLRKPTLVLTVFGATGFLFALRGSDCFTESESFGISVKGRGGPRSGSSTWHFSLPNLRPVCLALGLAVLIAVTGGISVFSSNREKRSGPEFCLTCTRSPVKGMKKGV